MKTEQINELSDDAANEAIRYIQQKMNIPNGHFAGLYFDDDTWGKITEIFSGYISAEIMKGKE
jgi:hypothetical protein